MSLDRLENRSFDRDSARKGLADQSSPPSRADMISQIASLADISPDQFVRLKTVGDAVLSENYVIGSGNTDLEEKLALILSDLGYAAQPLGNALLQFKKDHYLARGAEVGPSTVKALGEELQKLAKSGQSRFSPSSDPSPTPAHDARGEVLQDLRRRVVGVGGDFNHKAAEAVISQLEKGDFGIMDGQKSDAIASLKKLLTTGGYYAPEYGFSNEPNQALREGWNAFKIDHYMTPSTAVGVHGFEKLIDLLSGTPPPHKVAPSMSETPEKFDLSAYPLASTVSGLKPGEVPSTSSILLTGGLAALIPGVKSTRGQEVLADLTEKGYVQFAQDKQGNVRLLPGGNQTPVSVSSIGGSNGFLGMGDFGKKGEVLEKLVELGILERVDKDTFISAKLPDAYRVKPPPSSIPESVRTTSSTNGSSQGFGDGVKDAIKSDLTPLALSHTFMKEISEASWTPPPEVKDRSLAEQFAAYMVEKQGRDWHKKSSSDSGGAMAGNTLASILTSTVRPLDQTGNVLLHAATDVMKSWDKNQAYDPQQAKNYVAQSWVDVGAVTAGFLTGKIKGLTRMLVAGAGTAAVAESLQSVIDGESTGQAAERVTKAVALSLILDSAGEGTGKALSKLDSVVRSGIQPKKTGIPGGETAHPSNMTTSSDGLTGVPDKQTVTEGNSVDKTPTHTVREETTPPPAKAYVLHVKQIGRRSVSLGDNATDNVVEVTKRLDKTIPNENLVRYNETQERWGVNRPPAGYSSPDELPPQGIKASGTDYINTVRPGYERASELLKEALASGTKIGTDEDSIARFAKEYWLDVRAAMNYKGDPGSNQIGTKAMMNRREASTDYFRQLVGTYEKELKESGITPPKFDDAYIQQLTSLKNINGQPISQTPMNVGMQDGDIHIYPSIKEPLLIKTAEYYNAYIDAVRAGDTNKALEAVSKFVYAGSITRLSDGGINYSVVMTHATAMLRGLGIDDFTHGDLDLIAQRSSNWKMFDFFFNKAVSGELDSHSARQYGYVVGAKNEAVGETVIRPNSNREH